MGLYSYSFEEMQRINIEKMRDDASLLEDTIRINGRITDRSKAASDEIVAIWKAKAQHLRQMIENDAKLRAMYAAMEPQED